MYIKTNHVLLILLMGLFAVSAFAASGEAFSIHFFDVAYLLNQFKQQIPQLMQLIIAICYVSGFVLFAAGVMKLKATLSSGHMSYGEPIKYITIAVVLLFFPSTLDVMTVTFMGPGGGDVAYSYFGQQSNNSGYASIMPSVIGIIKLVGFIAFMKGWMFLLRVGNSQHGKGAATKGVLCVIGGILAVNIVTTTQLIKAAFDHVR